MSTTPHSRQATAIAAFALFALAPLTGCSTDSPAQHSEWLQKAAGLKVFYVETSKELWEKTSSQDGRDGSDLDIKSMRETLDNGLVQVELTGVSLANYVRVLDYMAHGGTDAKGMGRHRQEESIRMYDEISSVLDGDQAASDRRRNHLHRPRSLRMRVRGGEGQPGPARSGSPAGGHGVRAWWCPYDQRL